VAGDAFHQMTLELVQGGCAALEHDVVFARCLSKVFAGANNDGGYETLTTSLEQYAEVACWSRQLMLPS
jgi:hypothetical protein